MTLSVLDPVPALLVIDLQKGLMDRPTAHPLTEVVARTARLAAAFRRHGHPVALVVATGVPPGRREVVRVPLPTAPGWTDPVDELGAQASDLRITKQRPGAFTATSLDASLRSLGVTQVVVTGIATGAGVEATARSATSWATTWSSPSTRSPTRMPRPMPTVWGGSSRGSARPRPPRPSSPPSRRRTAEVLNLKSGVPG